MTGGGYGRIRHAFWTDPDIKRALTLEQKGLLLYYFTSPHSNLIGLYYCPFGYVAAETGLSVELVREWTLGILSKYLSYDEDTEEVFVHRTGRHQVGDELKQTDNRLKAIAKTIGESHSQQLVAKFLSMYSGWPLSNRIPTPPGKGNGEGLTKGLVKPLRSPPSRDSIAVAEHSIAVAGSKGLQNGEAPTDQREGEQAACVLFVRDQGYGPTEKLIAEGEDATAWNTPTGDRVPWPDRLRLLKLADAHLRAPKTKARDLRGALTYVILRQYDPLKHRTADEIQSTPKPGTEAALVRSETPGRERNGGSSEGLTLVSKAPEKPRADPQAEQIRRWTDDHPEQAEHLKNAIALRVQSGEGPRSDRAKKVWAEAELRAAILRAIAHDEHAA